MKNFYNLAKKYQYLMVILVSLLLIPDIGQSGTDSFTNLPIGARAAAMGNAFTAVANDASAFYHNPAGIGRLNWAYLSFNYQRIPLESHYSTVAFVHPRSKVGKESWSFGVAANFMYSPDTKDIFSPGYDLTQPPEYADTAYITVAYTFGENDTFHFGFNAKFIHEKFDSGNAYGGGLDIGFLMEVSFIDIGIMLQDIFTVEKFANIDDLQYKDIILKIGLATSLFTKYMLISVQMDKNLSIKNKAIFRIGGQFRIWHREAKTTSDVDDLEKAEAGDFDGALKPQKEFADAIYINAGYGDGDIGFGLTVQLFKMKFDLSIAFPELQWNRTNLLFTVAIPLY